MCGQAFVIVLTDQRPQREVVPLGNGLRRNSSSIGRNGSPKLGR